MARTVTVTLQDGTQHVYNNVPDTVTPDAITARAQNDFGAAPAHIDGGKQSAPASRAMPEPQKERGLGSEIGSYLSGLQQSLYDIPQSVVELGARGTDAIGLTNNAYRMTHDVFTASQPKGDKFFTGGRTVGNIATTIPFGGAKVVQGAGLLPRAFNAGVQGGLASALTSAASDAPIGEQIGLGSAVSAAFPFGGAAIRGLGKAAVGTLGETTGAGASSIRNAFAAGRQGGQAADAFKANLRGTAPMEQVVTEAKDALQNMRADRAKAYKFGMVDVSNDRAVLDFAPIDKAMAKANQVKSFKGVSISDKTADVRKDVQDAVDQWRALDPAQYHTPEGFDALKQKLGEIKDTLQYGTPQWKVANDAYSAVRREISKQAPAYDKVMQDYAKASDELTAIEKELSLGKKGNPNTALRKLQSIMRDNANTSWGKRADYGQALTEAGAANLMPSLAGQALSSPIPRGLAKYADLGLAATAALHTPGALAALPFASPRLVGEGAYALGSGVRQMNGMFGSIPSQISALNVPLSPALGVIGPRLAYQ